MSPAFRLSWLVALLTLAAPSAARSPGDVDEPDEVLVEPGAEQRLELEPPEPRRRGPRPTFFIAELGGGLLLGPDPARLVGGTLGVGGMYRGFPARFYAIGELEAMGGLTRKGQLEDQSPVRDELSTLAMGVGLRVYVPIVGPLRLLAEGTVGSLRMHARMTTPDASYEDATSTAYATLGIGPQFRILHQLSLGARYEATFVDMNGVPRDSTVGLWEPILSRRSRLLGTATFHF